MKILVHPSSVENIYDLENKNIDGIIIGLKNYSIFQSVKLDIDSIKSFKSKHKVYVSINKLIHNNELDDLKNNLIELSKLDIAGVFYEDVSVFKMNRDLNLNLKLIWSSMHLPCNYYTCNYWNKKGVSGALLSTELMLSDYIDIKKNTDMDIYVYAYGHIPIFESNRLLLTNFFNYKNKVKEGNIYNLYEKERDKYFKIYEEKDCTFITEDVLNSINVFHELKKNKVDYIILNGLMRNDSDFNNIIDEYLEAQGGYVFDKKELFTGFLFKESIYRVK